MVAIVVEAAVVATGKKIAGVVPETFVIGQVVSSARTSARTQITTTAGCYLARLIKEFIVADQMV